MLLPNWFKIIWWATISVALMVLLSERIPAFQTGIASGIDALLFIILVILLLLPLFNEFDLFGVKLKVQIASVKDQVTQLRNELINIGVNTQFNPQIYLTPPPDSQLPELERKYQKILDELKKERNIPSLVDIQADLLIPPDANYLFVVRYTIEKELRRIWMGCLSVDSERRTVPIQKILSLLQEAELIDFEMPKMIREVYSVCSPAIHGEEVSDVQLNFVRDIAPDLISALIEIK